MAEPVRFAAGLGLFLFPGVAWATVLWPRSARAAQAALGVLLAFTIVPLVAYLLNVFFRAPLRLDTFAYLAAALGLAAVAVRLAPALLASTSR